MPFPASSVLDDFNRANVGPPLSASWSNRPRIASDTGLTGLKVAGNAAVPDGTDHYYGSWWNVQTFSTATAPVEVWGIVGSYDREYIDLLMHIGSPGVDANMDGYILEFDYSSGTDVVRLFRVDNDAVTQVGADISLELGAGDGLGMRHDGSTFTIYHYDADGGGDVSNWATITTRTDSTYTSGYLGAAIHYGGNVSSRLSLTTFGGGYVPSPTSGVPLTRRADRGLVMR